MQPFVLIVVCMFVLKGIFVQDCVGECLCKLESSTSALVEIFIFRTIPKIEKH